MLNEHHFQNTDFWGDTDICKRLFSAWFAFIYCIVQFPSGSYQEQHCSGRTHSVGEECGLVHLPTVPGPETVAAFVLPLDSLPLPRCQTNSDWASCLPCSKLLANTPLSFGSIQGGKSGHSGASSSEEEPPANIQHRATLMSDTLGTAAHFGSCLTRGNGGTLYCNSQMHQFMYSIQKMNAQCFTQMRLCNQGFTLSTTCLEMRAQLKCLDNACKLQGFVSPCTI